PFIAVCSPLFHPPLLSVLFSPSCLTFSVPFLWFLFFHFFFFNVPASSEIYTLSLHDALPISPPTSSRSWATCWITHWMPRWEHKDRKSTRLNSSHVSISYAVFCLKKKKKKKKSQEENAKLEHDPADIQHTTSLQPTPYMKHNR